MKTQLHAIFLLLAIASYHQIALADSYASNASGNPQIHLTSAQTSLD